ncbi:hypothetical protein Bhyg_05956, partial [Pseudolycoriella hygida]
MDHMVIDNNSSEHNEFWNCVWLENRLISQRNRFTSVMPESHFPRIAVVKNAVIMQYVIFKASNDSRTESNHQ